MLVEYFRIIFLEKIWKIFDRKIQILYNKHVDILCASIEYIYKILFLHFCIMFQGKVYSYRNINGQEKTFEKTFENYDDYKAFIDSDESFRPFAHFPSFGFGNFDAFDRYLDNFFNQRIALPSQNSRNQELLPVSLEKYEAEAQRLEQEEQQKTHKKNLLEKSRERLQGYLDKFQTHSKKDERIAELVKEAEADMKKIEEELAKITG